MAVQDLVLTGESAISVPTPLSLIEMAVSRGADINTIERLVALHEKMLLRQAAGEFVSALNAFKAQPPVLEKVKTVDFSSKGGNRVHYSYAPLDHISKVLGEALSKHGLSFRWNVKQQDKQIDVTCILQHSGGHSESVTMTAGQHDDDRMNAIQRLGSTVTYLERYTLLAATGMATQEQDSDGNSEKFGELSERIEWLRNCRDEAELQKVFAQAYKDARALNDQDAMKALIVAKDKKRGEFRANS